MKKLLKLKRSVARSSLNRRLPIRRSMLFRSLIVAVLTGGSPDSKLGPSSNFRRRCSGPRKLRPGHLQMPGNRRATKVDFFEHHGFEIQRTVERWGE